LAIAAEDMAGVFQALVRRVPRVATACTVIVEGGVPESYRVPCPRTSGLSVAFGHYGGVAEAIDRVAVAGTVIAVLGRISSITCGTCHIHYENCHYGGSKTDSTHRIPPILNHQEPQLNLPQSNS
jgi:hypothetical protein